MNCIAKIKLPDEDLLYYVKLEKCQIVQNKYYNHILVIDNLSIKRELVNIVYNYPFLLKKYSNSINLKNIYIVTTYPKIKLTKVDLNFLNTEFRKIPFNNCHLMTVDDHYFNIFESCSNLIKTITEDGLFNELIVFSNSDYEISENTKLLITDMINSDKIELSVICNKDFINIPKINLYMSSEFDGESNTFFENIIQSGLFLKSPLKSVMLDIELQTEIFGTNTTRFTLDYNSNKIFLVKDKIDKIEIDKQIYELKEIEPNDDDMLSGIEFLLNYCQDKIITKAIYDKLKSVLINQISSSHNSENKNKSIILYSKLKKLFDKLVEQEIHKINFDDENSKIFVEYGKKSKVQINDKINFIVNKNIIKNVDDFKSKVLKDQEDISIKQFLETHKNSECSKFLGSCDFFNSPITLSNWFEEIKNNNGIGLLLKIANNNQSKVGVGCDISVKNITTTFLPIVDFVITASNFFEKNSSISFGNLNNSDIIKGTLIGNANAILPVYINKFHWRIVKKYVDPLLGIIVSKNPLSYRHSHKSLFFTVFIEMTKELFDNSKNMLNVNCIRVYITILRTCAEICFEKKFNYGIKNLLISYLNDATVRISKENSPHDKICSQSLVTGFKIEDYLIRYLYPYFIEEMIRLYIKKNKYDNHYIDFLSTLDDGLLEEEFNMIITHITGSCQRELTVLSAYYKMNSILNSMIKKYNSYSKFIKSLEENYGLLEEESCYYLLENINKNLNESSITIEKLYKSISKDYNKYEIIFLILQGVKHAENKTRRSEIEKGNYIDVLKINININSIKDYIKNWYGTV